MMAPDQEGNIDEGIRLIRQAADGGHGSAMISLANILRTGDQGLEINMGQAYEWYQKAADVCADGQFYLGDAHRHGYGVPVNPLEAERLFISAASEGIGQAILRIVEMMGLREIDGDLTRACDWLLKGAELGDVECQMNLAVMCEEMASVQDKQDRDQASVAHWFQAGAHWLEQAAQQGDDTAQSMLGHHYSAGLGVKKDCWRARQLLLPGVMKQDPDALYLMGILYQDPESDFHNEEAGMKYIKQAADLGDIRAQGIYGVYQTSQLNFMGAYDWITKQADESEHSRGLVQSYLSQIFQKREEYPLAESVSVSTIAKIDRVLGDIARYRDYVDSLSSNPDATMVLPAELGQPLLNELAVYRRALDLIENPDFFVSCVHLTVPIPLKDLLIEGDLEQDNSYVSLVSNEMTKEFADNNLSRVFDKFLIQIKGCYQLLLSVGGDKEILGNALLGVKSVDAEAHRFFTQILGDIKEADLTKIKTYLGGLSKELEAKSEMAQELRDSLSQIFKESVDVRNQKFMEKYPLIF